MAFSFLPKDVNFFELFKTQADCAVEAARFFKEVTTANQVDETTLKKMQAIEHKGDEAAHAIIDQLNKTFITPFDREDIHALTKEIDDIIDMVNTIVNRLKVYRMNPNDKNLIEFASVIEESVKAVASTVNCMRNLKNLKLANAACVEINRLENVGDAMRDRVLAELFDRQKDPITVIKWKEIYEDAETILDVCEDVAHVVGSILVKQA